MRRGHTLVALAVAGLMLLPGQASAAPTVAISGVTVSGGTGSVTGTASFQAITAAQSVVNEEQGSTFNAGSVPAQVADAIGMHLTDASITPIANGLRFTWNLLSMPDQVPPEGLRYVWAFKIGTSIYQLQAKRTNLASVSTTEDPVGTIKHHTENNNFFSLRGACVDNYTGTPSPVAGCYHLAYLPGSFNPASKTVTMDMPYETKDAIGRVVAPDFKPGAVVLDNAGAGTAGMVIAASGQAGVSNTSTSRYINGVLPFYTAPQVSLGVASAGTEPTTVTYGSATPLSGGTFTGNVSGLTATKNTVFARACNGVECTYTSFKAL